MVPVVKLLTFGTMPCNISLDGLSREDLLDLARRIEQRLLCLPLDPGGSTENASAGYRDCGIDTTDPWAAPRDDTTHGNPSAPATLSEKVQELNCVNDPWEGTGVGPTQWSLPFYGGHIVSAPNVLVGAPGMVSASTTLPVFGVPSNSGQNPEDPGKEAVPVVESPRRRWSKQCPHLCAVCHSQCCASNSVHERHVCERHRMQ